MAVIKVSGRRELFVKQVIFTLKSISYQNRVEIYRLPNGEEISASVETPKRFKTLQWIFWVFTFPMVFIHELSHVVVEHLLRPWSRPYRVTRKKRVKILLVVLAGPLSQIIICLGAILGDVWFPLKLYLILSCLIPLVIWTAEDYKSLLMLVGLWKPAVILYGFSASRGQWYAELFDRYRNQKSLRRYEQNRDRILREVEDLKKLFRTNLVERRDIP